VILAEVEMKYVALALVAVFSGSSAMAQSPQIYAPDGTYLGNLNSNQFDPNSVSNPYGQYGSQYSPNSINNPYGKYGSPYSPNSVNNPYANPQNTPRIVVPETGGYSGYSGYTGY